MAKFFSLVAVVNWRRPTSNEIVAPSDLGVREPWTCVGSKWGWYRAVSKTLQIRRLSFGSDTLFYVDGVIQSRSVAAKLSFTTNRDSVLSSHSGCHHGVENVGSSTALRCSNSVVRVDFEATMAAEHLDKSIAEGSTNTVKSSGD
jgi:hypothetical protein